MKHELFEKQVCGSVFGAKYINESSLCVTLHIISFSVGHVYLG